MKKVLTANQKLIENDITRFKNNSLSSNLALASLVFECLYFLIAYSQNSGRYSYSSGVQFQTGVLAGTYVYTIWYGASIILNLAILLSVFYSSIELKNYNKKFSYVVWAVAVIQLIRIYIFPIRTYLSEAGTVRVTAQLFGTGTLIVLIVCLVASAALLVASGVFGYTRAKKREAYLKQLEAGEIDIEAAYKEEDAQEVA